MSVHDGHRQRLRERFLKEGLDHFDEINVLEMLLFYCIQRKDTNELAHNLLDHFGSLPDVLDATVEDLCKVPGIGMNTATFLSFSSALNRYYQFKRVESVKCVESIEDCASFLMPLFLGRRDERVYMLCLDAKSAVICCKLIGEGSVTSANASVRKITELALSANACSVVLAHNHPSGLAIPSNEDIFVTQRIAKTLNDVDVRLVDHIIVADNEYVSLAASGVYDPDNLGMYR